MNRLKFAAAGIAAVWLILFVAWPWGGIAGVVLLAFAAGRLSSQTGGR